MAARSSTSSVGSRRGSTLTGIKGAHDAQLSGFLAKKPKNDGVGRTHSRLFVLQGSELKYYDPSNRKHKGTIDLTPDTVVESQGGGRFSIGEKRTGAISIRLEAETEDEATVWIEALQEAIDPTLNTAAQSAPLSVGAAANATAGAGASASASGEGAGAPQSYSHPPGAAAAATAGTTTGATTTATDGVDAESSSTAGEGTKNGGAANDSGTAAQASEADGDAIAQEHEAALNAEVAAAAAAAAAAEAEAAKAAADLELYKQHVAVLQNQVRSHGDVPLEYMTLEQLESELSETLQRIQQNPDAAADLERFDALLKAQKLHPAYLQREKEAALKWEREEMPKLALALEEVRGFIPPNIASCTKEELDSTGLPPALSRRIWTNRCLWLVRMHPEDIARLHIADLTHNYGYDGRGLDTRELRAILGCLPDMFEADGKGLKAKWRSDLRDRIRERAQTEGTNVRIHAAYRSATPLFDAEDVAERGSVAIGAAFDQRTSFLSINRSAAQTDHARKVLAPLHETSSSAAPAASAAPPRPPPGRLQQPKPQPQGSIPPRPPGGPFGGPRGPGGLPGGADLFAAIRLRRAAQDGDDHS